MRGILIPKVKQGILLHCAKEIQLQKSKYKLPRVEVKRFSEDELCTPLYLVSGWIKLPKLEAILNIMCQPKALVSLPFAA